MTSITHHLLGQSRTATLGALLLHPESSLHVRELARLTGASPGSLHRELRTLADLGLLLRQEVGRQVHYRANTANPIYPELAGLLRKTSGLVDVLGDSLAPLGTKVKLAFLYGSIAAGTERSGSDVDLMVLGSATFADLARALASTHSILRRDVNPTIMTPREFSRKIASGDGFARSVVKGARLWVVGGEDDFTKLASHRAA